MNRYYKFGILKYFAFSHLPEELQTISKPFSELAYQVADNFIDNDNVDIAETIAGIRKILEAKDCAVRAMLK